MQGRSWNNTNSGLLAFAAVAASVAAAAAAAAANMPVQK